MILVQKNLQIVIVKTCCLCACHLQLRCCLASVSSPRLQPQGSTPAQPPLPVQTRCRRAFFAYITTTCWNPAQSGMPLVAHYWHQILTNCNFFGITFSPIATLLASYSPNSNFFGITFKQLQLCLASHSHQLPLFWHHTLTN